MLLNHVRTLEEIASKANNMSMKIGNAGIKMKLEEISIDLHRYAMLGNDLNNGINMVQIDLKKCVNRIIDDLNKMEKKHKKDKEISISLKWWQKELSKFINRNVKKWKELGIK
jgi:hypothetical protein